MTETNPNKRPCVANVQTIVMVRSRWKNAAKKRGMTLSQYIHDCVRVYEAHDGKGPQHRLVVDRDPE